MAVDISLGGLINTGINLIKSIFGGGGPPYIMRLTQQAVPLAQSHNLPVLAYVDTELIGFSSSGQTFHAGSGANATNAGVLLDNALKTLGDALLITQIEPLEYKPVYPPAGSAPTGSLSIPGVTASAGFDTGSLLTIAGIGLVAYLFLKGKK